MHTCWHILTIRTAQGARVPALAATARGNGPDGASPALPISGPSCSPLPQMAF